ncbi:PREDICTED: multiple PDZ domain protein-like [Priapulus caudatus]|uniref:Multiple PDZ domain protein-like n=1 Tax=Priapulus caudatus TaxID=37621 RepID=A0ABM1EHT3_PRICU|nr:PREDICTED: multiple PDZ domain protein-like [Priapulus caudatus]
MIERDGRLQEGDQILAIDGQPLDAAISHQQAIAILQQAHGLVELVVARDNPRADQSPSTSIQRSATPSSDAEQDLSMWLNTEWAQASMQAQGQEGPLVDINGYEPDTEMETFQVQLAKDEGGLGITIAGYIGEREEISGIFVKSISEGSAAELDGRVRVNDQIVAVVSFTRRTVIKDGAADLSLGG